MRMSEIKAQARSAIHAEAAEPCVYRDRTGQSYPSAEQSAGGLVLSARFKTKLRAASMDSDSMSILENVESVILNSPQWVALGIEPQHGATLDFPGYGFTLRLDQEMDPDGPLNRYWTVTRA